MHLSMLSWIFFNQHSVNFSNFKSYCPLSTYLPCPGSSVVSVSDSLPACSEFETLLRQNFFPFHFRLLSQLKHVRKVASGFGNKSCVSTRVRKPGNTCASPTAMIITLAVKVALNLKTTTYPLLN